MRKQIFTIAVLTAFAAVSDGVLACDPGGAMAAGGMGSKSFGAMTAGGYNSGGGQQYSNPMGAMAAMAAMQQQGMNQARANFAAQGDAYRERMRPIRQAAAIEKREQTLAKRQVNREKIMAQELARRNALQNQEPQQPESQTVQFASQSPFRETQTVVHETPPVEQPPFSYAAFFK